MNSIFASRTAAALGFLAVALGAFGAHGLKEVLTQNGMTAIWDKAVFYHFVHTVVLFVLAERSVFPQNAGWLFLAGIFLFSGSLYLMVITGAHWLGAVTPVGGICLLAGWAVLIFRRRD
jgi:uncharacterized membrane protein YgdD (TMEM256/DUF423 family)